MIRRPSWVRKLPGQPKTPRPETPDTAPPLDYLEQIELVYGRPAGVTADVVLALVDDTPAHLRWLTARIVLTLGKAGVPIADLPAAVAASRTVFMSPGAWGAEQAAEFVATAHALGITGDAIRLVPNLAKVADR